MGFKVGQQYEAEGKLGNDGGQGIGPMRSCDRDRTTGACTQDIR